MASAPSGPQRILALDFTKGVLVLLMIVYHWVNYFVGSQSDLLRYLRFLTPSFIFITGFLISARYLVKYNVNDPEVSRRLAWRGIKILGVFVFLNALISAMSVHPHDRTVFDPFSVRNFLSIYLTGNTAVAGVGKVASFFILVPISYLLLLSAVLLMLQARSRGLIAGIGAGSRRLDGSEAVIGMFCGVCMLCFLGIWVLYFYDLESSNLELLSIGLLGVLVGHVSLQKIDGFSNHPYLIAIAYFCYVMAITIWNVVLPLQVVGVCLGLLIIYLVGATKGRLEGVREGIMLFGRYSLLAYVGQIAVIQLLSRGLRQFNLGIGQLGVSLLGAFVFTALIVEVVDRVRRRSATMDRMYRAVFA